MASVRTIPPCTEGQLRCAVESDRDLAIVHVAGELDIATVPELDTVLRELRDSGFERLRLDLRELTFLDGRGVMQLRRWCDLSALDGFELRLVLPVGAPLRAIELTGQAAALRRAARTGRFAR